MDSHELYYWTAARVDAECKSRWGKYDREKTAWYTEYFRDNPHRHPKQAWSAKNIACALPPRWEELAALLPSTHTFHLSGKSSQVLALGLLGAAGSLAPSHDWLRDALNLPPKPKNTDRPKRRFEFELGSEVLNETSGPTNVDYFVADDDLVVCIECKWRENGLGTCGCAGRKGCDPVTGACYPVMRDQRPAVWSAAKELFGLPARAEGRACPLHPVYQAVRNAAAAMNLRPDGGLGIFGLIYDADNPYFAGHGHWPGWAAALTRTLPDMQNGFRFRAVSWQQLMASLVLDDATRAWAREKHRLG